jgi:hypothetical protein
MESQREREEKWKRIIETYQRAKELYLLAEEVGNKLRSWVPPLLQFRDCLEHIVRAEAVHYGLKEETDPSYVENNLDKALGHVYRAFFDTADWCAVIVRAEIEQELTGYSNEAIEACLPTYYSAIRPETTRFSEQIAKIRETKDVCSGSNSQLVEEYAGLVRKMISYRSQIGAARPALEQFRQKERQTDSSQRRFQWLLLVVGTILGAILGYLLAKL